MEIARHRSARRLALGLLTGLVAVLAAPASALATDFFVDRDTGNNTNDCSTHALACDTVSRGVTFATNAGSGNRVLVDDSPTAYSEGGVTLFADVDVVADNSVAGTTTESPTGKPIIQNSAAQIFFIAASPSDSPGTTIRGFTLRPNGGGAIVANGQMTSIEDNDFEGPASPVITDGDTGISVGASSPLINDNTFARLKFGITTGLGSSPTISANEFSGTHNGNSLQLTFGSVTPTVVTGNFIHNLGAGSAQAVRVGNPGPTATVSVAFHRNRILAPIGIGVNVNDTAGPVSFDGDLIAGTTLAGIAHGDFDSSGDAAISATNVTVVSATGADILSDGATLTLDSSILGAGGITDINGATCLISFSRGPVTGAGCDNFQTTADPMFVNPVGNDFHLLAGSPMIDSGNPASPPVGTLDLDGQARVLEGDSSCPDDPRRDIGADEFSGATPPTGCQPPAAPASPAPPSATPKKCKKGQKLKKGRCVKKKKHR
jgi:hypothetical protein